MDGLTHPRDLEAWRRDQHARRPVSARLRSRAGAARAALRPAAPLVLARRGPAPARVVVALESRSPASVSALLAPLGHLDGVDVAVVAPLSVVDLLPPGPWVESPLPPDAVGTLAADADVVLATGHYLPVGAAARAAVADPRRFVTVQHGLLTPDVPPLADSTTLLAWSGADAAFWAAGRPDVTASVVGSPLLWAAGADPVTADPDARPVFLGQLHGTDLPRPLLAAAAETFCRETGATYRPHPAERDRASLAVHARLEVAGIRVDRSGVPLRALRAPVASVFSTGVLEAAAAGLPAWVHCPDAPHWLEDFWHRYRLARFGGPPTPSPERPDTEPSAVVAGVVHGMMGP